MDGILNKVKDAVVDKALGRDNNDEDRDRDRDSGRTQGNYDQGSSYGRQNEHYGLQDESHARTAGGYNRDTAERSRDDNYSTHGGQRQPYEDTSRDVRGYPRDSAPHSGSYAEEGTGYGGHGGRAVSSRLEDDPRDASAREYRPAQGSGGYGISSDYSGAREVAARHTDSGDSSLFDTALGFLRGREKDLERDDVDEGEYVRNHKELYEEGGAREEKNSQSLGQAAALQALKKFTGGGTAASGAKDQNAFIGLAMAEAVKLFDSQSSKGNVAPGETKQDVVGQVAQYALKLFLKSRFDAGGSGGGGSGLMSLASQFLK